MQEPCVEQCAGAGPALAAPVKAEPSWTPEDFLQSTLREGEGVLCPTGRPKPRGRRKQQWKLKFHHQALPPEYLDHYEASLTKARHMEPPPPPAPAPAPPAPESIHGWLQRVTGLAPPEPPPPRRRRAPPAPAPPRVLNYSDLPYMGEMTLDNSKPRRGRKPKKADICHLIYKNYGTVPPGAPARPAEPARPAPLKREGGAPAPGKRRTDLQNRIISSLLEKRLSQESARGRPGEERPARPVPAPSSPVETPAEPLNLCVRDLNNLKIRLLRKHGNVYAKAGEGDSPTEAPPETPSPGGSEREAGAESPLPGGYVYWPAAGVFVHPLALQSQLLYYRGLAAGGAYTVPPPPPPPPPPDGSPETPAPEPPRPAPAGPRPEKPEKPAAAGAARGGPGKRKRSAIFIPPVPSEAGASPATEVSICKFKFTGGARPSLQEKKMLSVDAGGNFRYYSGTGDKSGRGYEFFPRETSQQSAGAGAGAAAVAAVAAVAAAAPPGEPARRKRKSRKSLQRERLERTFKEKGFLIQTQQLESAEGATYCKFRQLRKFTRYLFRSWKDYLPGAAQGEEGPAPPPDA